MAALCNRGIIFLSFFLLFSSPNLSRRRLDVYHTSKNRKKIAKIRHLGTIAQLCRAISSQLRHISTIGKKLLNSNFSPTHPHNMVNFGPLAAETCWRVWGTPVNFNVFCVLAALLHGTLVVGVSQTFRRWTEGATYIRQGGHHVGHWPTFLVPNNYTDLRHVRLIYGAADFQVFGTDVYLFYTTCIAGETKNCQTLVRCRLRHYYKPIVITL